MNSTRGERREPQALQEALLRLPRELEDAHVEEAERGRGGARWEARPEGVVRVDAAGAGECAWLRVPDGGEREGRGATGEGAEVEPADAAGDRPAREVARVDVRLGEAVLPALHGGVEVDEGVN